MFKYLTIIIQRTSCLWQVEVKYTSDIIFQGFYYHCASSFYLLIAKTKTCVQNNPQFSKIAYIHTRTKPNYVSV